MDGFKPAPNMPCRLSSSLNSIQGVPGLLIELLSTVAMSEEVRSSLEMGILKPFTSKSSKVI